MNIFSLAYQKILLLSKSKYAQYFLFLISYIEAIFLPFPPDIMLITLIFADKLKWMKFVLITLIGSVLGGIAGYYIGFYCIDLVYPYIIDFGYNDSYLLVQDWFSKGGFWIVFVAGFTPIPYKIFTIGAGAFQMNLPIFILASIVSRGARFGLVGFICRKFESSFTKNFVKYLDLIGWTSVLIILIYFYFIR